MSIRISYPFFGGVLSVRWSGREGLNRGSVKTLKRETWKLRIMNPPAGFRTFENLEAYQAAREFRKKMYGVVRRLPAQEKYDLASQIRRAAVSLTNNITEGHGRYHYLDQIKFCLISRGSLEELLDDLNICDDEAYLPSAEIAGLKEQGWRLHGLLNGYIRYLRRESDSSLHRGRVNG